MTLVETTTLSGAPESSRSAVSWGAILAGAVVAAAVSLMLLLLGSGLGFASLSPWQGAGVSAGTFAVSAAIWFIVVQWIAAAFGGYVTGRLRTKWVDVHTDEVFFRDTAHGFVAWCVATLLVAGLLTSAVSSVVSTGTKAAASVASGAAEAVASAAGGGDPTAYLADILLRPAADRPAPASATDSAATRAEFARILATDGLSGTWPDEDKAYLAERIAAVTGIAPADAQKRVDDVLAKIEAAKAKAKEAADAARKAGLAASVMAFLSLLIGAFIASVAAALGGRWRDEDVPSTS